MSFSVSEESNLINSVEKHPVLYDAGHADYWNNLLKENVWKSIGKELNKTSEDCKKKWKFIRDGYNRFKKTHKLGTGSAAPKNSKNCRHHQLLFLDGVSQHRSGGSNIPMSPQELTENEEDADKLSTEEQFLVSESADANLANQAQQSYDDNVIEDPREQTQTTVKRRKRNKEDELLQMWRERDKNRQILLQSLQQKDDDVSLFCRHIAEVLRNLPPVEKAQAKKHLSLVLSDYEIMAVKNTSLTPNSTTLSNYTTSPELLASASSSQYSSPTPDSVYNLPGPSNVTQFVNLPTTGPAHYNTPNAYFPMSSTSTSPVPELLFEGNQERE